MSEILVEKTLSGYNLNFNGDHILAAVSHLQQHSDGRLTGSIGLALGKAKKEEPTFTFNFTSDIARKRLINTLNEKYPDWQWLEIIDNLCAKVQALTKVGEDDTVIQPSDPRGKHPGYYIEPVIMKGVPNVIYGDKGVNKTTLCLVMMGIIANTVTDSPSGLVASERANIALLDWENNRELTEYTASRLVEGEAVPYFELPYLRCSRPLSDDMERIGAFLYKHKSNLIMIDSLGKAAGSDSHDSSGKNAALRFFECLDRFEIPGLTTLIIGQNSKDDTGKKSIFGCYSSDTEVLTDKGWKLHPDVSLDDKVACLDFTVRPHVLRWENPLKLWEYDYTGDMINIKNVSTDIMVTPNHNLFIKQNSKVIPFEKWQLVEASAVPYSFKIKHSAPMAEKGKHRTPQYFKLGFRCKRLPMNDWLRFLGYWISEGSLNTVSNQIQLTQNGGDTLNSMRQTLDNLGFVYSESVRTIKEKREGKWQGNRKPCYTLTLIKNPGEKVNSNKYKLGGIRRKNKGVRKVLANWLIENCGRDKYIKRLPEFVWTLSRKQMDVFLQALLDGDGSQIDAYNFRYYTASKQLADDVQKLAICIGYSTIGYSRVREEKFLTYEVGITKKSRQLRINRRKHIAKVPYNGKVYCLSVPTGVYLTRRNGKTAIQGNSTYYTYYSRNIFRLQRSKDKAEEDEMRVALFHEEGNFSGKYKPQGFRLNYTKETISIVQEAASISEYLEGANQTKTLLDFLKNGAKSVSAIAVEIGASDNRTRSLLSKLKSRGLIMGLGSGMYALPTNQVEF